MIKVENIDMWGFEHAVRGMRLPMNSGNKSDSYFEDEIDVNSKAFSIGENDLALMQRLFKAGVEHRTYARLIQVSMDVTAPLYWWKEADRYSVGKCQISTSTMHTIHKRPFELDDFSCEHLFDNWKTDLHVTIGRLNEARELYLETKNKMYWWQMIQLLPSSYNQKRTIMMSYEVVFKIIKERSDHKLDEWVDFVEVLKGLPYVKEIIDFKE